MNAGTKRLLTWAPLGLALVLALVWLFRPAAVPVDLVKVERGPLTVSVSDEGETRVRDMYVVSAPVTGRLDRLSLKAGDVVELAPVRGVHHPDVTAAKLVSKMINYFVR